MKTRYGQTLPLPAPHTFRKNFSARSRREKKLAKIGKEQTEQSAKWFGNRKNGAGRRTIFGRNNRRGGAVRRRAPQKQKIVFTLLYSPAAIRAV